MTSAVPLSPPDTGETWVGLAEEELPVAAVSQWVVRADCGAVVVFCGTTRDHSGDRQGVEQLDYEAYEDHVVTRLEAIAASARTRWPDLGRVALLHRVGVVEVGQTSVVVAVSAPHRDHAFEAARFGIDTLKHTVPIWKRERWADGESWGLEAQHVTDVETDGSDR